jgi:hypothetical protein
MEKGLKKKFKEDDEFEMNKNHHPTQHQSELANQIKKDFKIKVNEDVPDNVYNHENEQITHNNKINICDFRFLDVKTFETKIFTFIHHNSPNKILLKLLEGIESENFFYKDIMSKYDKNLVVESEDKTFLQSILECAYLEFLDRTQNILKQDKCKIIFYLDLDEKTDLLTVIHSILKIKTISTFYDLILLTDSSISSFLETGINIIYLPKNNIFTGKGIGLIPIEKSIISTKGLKWDVNQWETFFGSPNISTSNEIQDYIDGEIKIIVETGLIVFTAEINPEQIQLL